MSQSDNNFGLFPVNYIIQPKVDGIPLLGAAVLNLQLLINAPEKTLSGIATTFKAISPPMHLVSNVHGTWSYMATMSSTHLLLVAEGQGPSTILVQGQPQLVENLKVRASVEENWQSGVCNFEYLYQGTWHKVEGAQMSIETFDQSAVLDQLQTTVQA